MPTPRSYAGRHLGVAAICCACGHAVTLDLLELASGPHADTPLIELPLRCQCGARDSAIRVTYEGKGARDP